jgi:hypothetical protein
MRAFWGLALVLFGLGYLGAGLAWWGYDIPNSLWQFWPLILVFWGLDLVTRKTSFYIPVMIIAVILAAAFVYVSLYNQVNNLNRVTRSETLAPKTTTISAELPKESKSTKILVETGAVDFKIAGETEKLISGLLISNFVSPQLSFRDQGSVSSANLSTVSEEAIGRNGWWRAGRNLKNELTLALNSRLPLDLTIRSGASKLDFDLTKYQLSALDLESGASAITLKVGDLVQDKAVLALKTGASSIDITLPKSVGVKITAETGFSSKDFAGYTEKDGAWYSEGYDTKVKKIELRLSAGASSLKVR